MGCGASTGQPVQPANAAEKLLADAFENDKYILKVLLLGAGESGKSTVVKQIKVIGNVQENTSEKSKYRSALRRNIIEAIQVLLAAADTLGVPIEENLQSTGKEILSLDNTNASLVFSHELAVGIDALWKSPSIQTVYSRRSEYWLMDATPYYLNEVFRIAADDFEPTEEDMIMTRVRTTGIVVSEIAEKPYKFQIVDVGGQRSERRKWIHCFDDVKAIIYLASLSGYNQVLFEDNKENIMNESLNLFEDIVKNPIFKNTPIFVYLNKKDLFEELIKTKPLTACFPDYDGPAGEMAPALDFIKAKFAAIMAKHVPGKAVHFHVIAARVRMDMKIAFSEVKGTLKKLHPVRKATQHRLPEETSIRSVRTKR